MTTKKTAKADVGKIFKINEKALQAGRHRTWPTSTVGVSTTPEQYNYRQVGGQHPSKETTVSLIWCWYALPTSSSSS
jgi:hypothetical protein